ncbi:MAG: diacylglycerol kinase family protein [Ferruginibacter sp.]
MKRFFLSFTYAAEGFLHSIKKERNFMLHCLAAVAVITAGFAFHINDTEWMILLLNIALVMALEMLNTAIERLCNLTHPQHHPMVKIIKDVSAGAVLIAAVVAFICGCIIFFPRIF